MKTLKKVFKNYYDIIRGLIILEKTGVRVKLMTCAGFFVEDGVEDQIIAKTERLNMRIVNAAVLTD